MISFQSTYFSLPWGVNEFPKLSFFNVRDSVPFWYLSWHRKVWKCQPTDSSSWCCLLATTNGLGDKRSCLLTHAATANQSTPQSCCSAVHRRGRTLTFRRIVRFLSDNKWTQRSITSLAIWICTGIGGSTSGPASFSSILRGTDSSSGRRE